MDRRNFIKCAAAASASPVAISSPASAGSSLLAHIHEHERLYAVDSKAWDAVAELDDQAMQSAPREAVQVSRLLVGTDADGQKIFKPIFESTEEGVRKYYQELAQHAWYMFPTRQSAKWLSGRVAAIDAEMGQKLNELEARRAARKRHEDECGYTAALEAARASAEKVRCVERLIIDHVPATLQEAALKARWLVEKVSDDKSYLLDTEGALEDALAAIGRVES